VVRIYIPTRGRPDRQPAMEALLAAGFKPILVLSESDPEFDAYYKRWHGHTKLHAKAKSIAEKRQQILACNGNVPFVMIDDDLRFYKRSREGKRFSIATSEQLRELFYHVEAALELYAHVGISDKFMAQTRPRNTVGYGRYNQFLAYNPKLFPKPWPKFRLTTNQEHDFHLQLATRGRPPCILTEYSKNATFYSKGGCSHYRTPTLERRMFREMKRLWPDLVTLKKIDRRPGIRMQVAWKKAVEYGQDRSRVSR
jgi:hypothetical protein